MTFHVRLLRRQTRPCIGRFGRCVLILMRGRSASSVAATDLVSPPAPACSAVLQGGGQNGMDQGWSVIAVAVFAAVCTGRKDRSAAGSELA